MVRIYRHQGDHGHGFTPPSTPGEVVAEGPWSFMYTRDKYARDRVMKSARLLLPHVQDGETVLDVGCFTQEASKYFQNTINYIGIDNVKYHRNTRVVELNHGFEPIPANHALCLETLEHLVDPEDCLLSIVESLSEGSYLVVSLPNESTLFHRLRCLLGTVDYGCFQGEGKHLHLPSLHQARKFLSVKSMTLVREVYYISPTACNSGSQWLGKILSLIPDYIHQFLADKVPSLFARGFIFLLRKSSASSTQDNNTHTPPSV